MIDLGENFLADIAGYIGDLFSDFSPLFFVIVGLALAFWIIDEIFEILVREREKEE